MKLQSQLTKAFKALRAQGFIARKSFMCCSGCAGNELGIELLRLHDAGELLPQGVIYYHKQDAESFSNPRRGNLMIRFGQITAYSSGGVRVASTELPTKAVGEAAMKAFREAGITASWDGDPDQCIEVVISR